MFPLALIPVLPGITAADQPRRERHPVQLARFQDGTNSSATGLGRHSSSGTGLSRDRETAPVVESLRLVLVKLNQVGRNYDGHRVKAIEHLHQAIWTLQPNLAGVRTGGRVGAASTMNASSMPQAQPDSQLRLAYQQLRSIESRMLGRGGNGPTYHRQAHTHVQRAIQELDDALAAR